MSKRERLLNKVKGLFDQATDSIEENDDGELEYKYLSFTPGQVSGELSIQHQALNKYGTFHTLDSQYESVDYSRWNGITLDVEKWIEEREQDEQKKREIRKEEIRKRTIDVSSVFEND